MNLDELLNSARLPERTVQVCLRGDLQADFEELQRQLVAAQNAPRDSIADGGTVHDLAQQIEALREQMTSHTLTVRLRAMPRADFVDLSKPHKVREDEPRDRILGVNTETFFPTLIRRAVVEPAFTDAQWERFTAALTDQQYDEIATAAWNLNRGKVDVPFSLAASQIMSNSGSR